MLPTAGRSVLRHAPLRSGASPFPYGLITPPPELSLAIAMRWAHLIWYELIPFGRLLIKMLRCRNRRWIMSLSRFNQGFWKLACRLARLLSIRHLNNNGETRNIYLIWGGFCPSFVRFRLLDLELDFTKGFDRKFMCCHVLCNVFRTNRKIVLLAYKFCSPST